MNLGVVRNQKKRSNREGPGDKEPEEGQRTIVQSPVDLQPGPGGQEPEVKGRCAPPGPQTHLCLLKSCPEGLHSHVMRLSSTQATWRRARVGWDKGPVPAPQKNHFHFPGLSQPLEQDADLPHLLTAVCPPAGHLPSMFHFPHP